MRLIPTLLAGLVITTSAQASELRYPFEPFSEPKIYKDGDWELRIYYRHKGTANEAMHGELLFQGKRPVAVVPPGYVQTPFGGVTFFIAPKHFEKLDFKQMVIGWTFRDYEKTPWTSKPHPTWSPRSDWRQEEVKFLP